MSFFPHTLVSHDPTPSTFHPLFRLLDDFDQYTRTSSGASGNNNSAVSQQRERGNQRSITQSFRSFTPRFDVQEHDNVYELHGELPGIEQKDVEIEFIDDQTLSIRGRTERSFSTGDEDDAAEGQEQNASHRATVEDAEDTDADKSAGKAKQQGQQVAKVNSQQQVAKHSKPQPKYWVSERSIGEFSRSFTFPARVDQENVSASMKNGVLNIVVPKAKKVEGRKITIS